MDEVATEQGNAKGGIGSRKVTILTADDQAVPSEGITAVQKVLTRDRVTALISCSYAIALI